MRMRLNCFFFFSSRRRHTRWTGDWSSDVCSSDLLHCCRSAPGWCEGWRRLVSELGTIRVVKFGAEKPRRAHQEVSGATGQVDDAQLFDLARRPAGGQRPKGFAHEEIHHRRRRVVRAARFSCATRPEVEGPGFEPANEADRLSRSDRGPVLVFILSFFFLALALVFSTLLIGRVLRMQGFSRGARDESRVTAQRQVLVRAQEDQLLGGQHQLTCTEAYGEPDRIGHCRLVLEQPFVDGAELLDFQLAETHALASYAAAWTRGGDREEDGACGGVVHTKPREQCALRGRVAEQASAAWRDILEVGEVRREALVENAEEDRKACPDAGSVRRQGFRRRREESGDQGFEPVALLIQAVSSQALIA